ncbi:MAG: hypothetical protein RLZZ555_800 [Pseudomonadota bacterium]|jgi:hypothetical protein
MSSKPFDWKPAYLAALRQVPVIKHACEAAGIDRTTAWRAREADEEFAKAEQEAMEEGIDRAEAEAFRRGVVGFEEPVIDKGRLAYRYERYVDDDGVEHYRLQLDEHGQPIPLTVRKHSDAMLGLLLKGRRKKVYADRTELTGPEGGPVQQVDETAKAARVAQLLALAQARKTEADEFGDLA